MSNFYDGQSHALRDLFNLKNVKKIHEWVLVLVKLQLLW